MSVSEIPIAWKRLSNLAQPPAGLVNESVVSCFLSKVFHYSEGRNAYWGTWSSTYPGDLSFDVNPSSLKDRIESQRKQGSQFTLSELPALALRANSYDLVLFQTWGRAPFQKIPRDAITGNRIFEIAHAICQREPWINTFILPKGAATNAVVPFKTYRSSPHGTQYYLDWDPLKTRYDLIPIMALVSDVTQHLNDG